MEDQLITNFHTSYQDFDVIMIADQAETDQGGVVSDAFREVLPMSPSGIPKKIVVVDSRNRIDRFRSAIAKRISTRRRPPANGSLGRLTWRACATPSGGVRWWSLEAPKVRCW